MTRSHLTDQALDLRAKEATLDPGFLATSGVHQSEGERHLVTIIGDETQALPLAPALPAAPEPVAEPAPFVCEVCGRTFTRKQGLGRHMHETHGAPTTRQQKSAAAKRKRNRTGQKGRSASASRPAPMAPPVTTGLVAVIEREMHELTEPMRVRLAAITADIETKRAELTELSAAKLYLEHTLNRIEPRTMPKKPGPKPKKPTTGVARGAQMVSERGRDEKRRATLAYLTEHQHELREGFTGGHLARMMKAANVQPVTSPSLLLRILDDLRDAGIVRADRKIRGGGMRWMIVGSLNGQTTMGDRNDGTSTA